MKKQLLKFRATALLFALGAYQIGISQTNPTAQTLPYSQNFGTGTFTVAPTGMAVWTITNSPASSQSDAESSTPNGNATITAATATQTTGDAYGYATSSNGRLYFQTSSNATNGTNQPVLAIATTGLTNISVVYGIEMISGTARTIGFVLQYRIGTSGSWTDVSGGVYSHNSSDRTNGQVDNFSVILPTAAENQSVVQLRWACWRGTQSGNSSGAALDNISVSGTTQVGGYFRSKQNGNWNVLSTWQASPDSATWVNATVIPSYHANSILVKDSVSITATDSIDQVTVSTSGILTYANITGSTVYIMNGTGVDLNVLGKYYDAGPNNTVWATSSSWQLGSTASLIRNRNTSSNNWQTHYNTIANIPATSNWYIIKNSSDDPSLSSTSNVHYGNLYMLNTTGTLWTTPSSSSFTGSADFPTVKGNLYIGSNVSFLNNNTNASPVKVVGNTTIVSGSTIRNQGTGFELQGDVTINGTISTTGSAYILLSGNNTQTMSGSGLSFQYLTVHKSSFPASVTLSSPATITGTLTLTNGLIVTDTVNLLTFNAGAAVNGINNDTSFVSGPVKKIGNTAFTFPLGKNANAQTIAITAPTNSSDAFQAEYFDTNPTTVYGIYTDSTFNYVSTCEYFVLKRKNGTSNIQPTLSYDPTACISNLLPAPRVIGYNGTKWKDLGLSNFTISPSGGTVSTATVITQYGAITLGNYNPLITNTPNGDTCFAAIVMPNGATSTLTGQTQSTKRKWYTFTPTTPEIKITLKNTSMGSNHIHDIALLEGLCYDYISVGYDSSRTDTTLSIVLHEALVGAPYFISTFKERTNCSMCTSSANFDLTVQCLPNPIQTVSGSVVSFNGQRDHKAEEVIVRIDKNHLNLTNVNNTSMKTGKASDFFDSDITSSIATLLYNNDTAYVNNLHVKKVYPSLTSNDTIRLSIDSQMVRMPAFYETFVLSLPKNTKLYNTSRQLTALQWIKYAQPNFVVSVTSVPNDSCYPVQASLHPTATYPAGSINAEGAWDIETGESFVNIGIYDTGIDGTHIDLNGSKVGGGYDYFAGTSISPGTDNDSDGHGTGCAGIAGGYRNNGKVTAGIAGGNGNAILSPGVTLWDMKMVGGAIATSDIAQAINDGVNYFNLHIMSNSWTLGSTFDPTLHDAVQNAVKCGVIYCASRGNFNYPYTATTIDQVMYPACFQDEMVINVGASGTDGAAKSSSNGDPTNSSDQAYFSMDDNNVDVLAPGTTALVYTAKNGTNSYQKFNGTSAACPHVAGVAGLMLSYLDQPYPSPDNLAIEDVEQILQKNALNMEFGPGQYDIDNGYGLINATSVMNHIIAPYKLQHFQPNQFGVQSNITPVKIADTIPVHLTEAYEALDAGDYKADVYLVTIIIDYTLDSPTDQIIGYWPRFSSTIGWSQDTPISTDNWCHILSCTSTEAVFQTYQFDFKKDQNNNPIDPMYPENPTAAITIYTKTGTAGIDKVNGGNMAMTIYPNPATNSTTISVSLSTSQEISLEIYDMQGRLVKALAKERASQGTNQFNVSLSDMATGMYYARLITENSTFEKKLIIAK